MTQCPYVYCRAWRDDGQACPACGHPADPADLRSPAWLAQAVAALPPRPDGILDLHQILPAHPQIVAAQRRAMDALGVSRALLQSAPAEAPSLLGNAALTEVVAGAPERFWGSWFVDPRRDDARAELEAVAAHGIRVVKLIPATGWAPDEPALRPFWSAMARLRLVAMVHTGFVTARHKHEEARAGQFLSSRYADPLLLDRPCREHPDLAVILSHGGGALFARAAARMCTEHAHVWADVSATGVFALRDWLSGVVPVDWRKVFWGNDGPPLTYPLNLRLLLGALAAHGADALAAPLLRDNGAAFAAAWLDP